MIYYKTWSNIPRKGIARKGIARNDISRKDIPRRYTKKKRRGISKNTRRFNTQQGGVGGVGL